MTPNGEGPRGPGRDDAGEEIHVEDRRRFNPATGEARPDTDADSIPLPGGGVLKGHAEDHEALPVGFGELVHPFVLMGLMGLGVIPHPESGGSEIHLGSARTAIECIELLKTRTEGNRTEDETRLIEAALYELKLQFVEARERSKRG